MGLFNKEVKPQQTQRSFAEENFNNVYQNWASGKKCRGKDDYFIADMHASYVILQYLKDLENEIYELRVQIDQMKKS